LFTEAHALAIDTDRVRLLELPASTVITPLAREELKARGIGVRLRSAPDTRGAHAQWGFGIGASLGLAPALRRALASESDDWIEHEVGLPETVRFLAEDGSGSLLFVADAAVVVHDAIAIHGVRAASVWDVDSAVRARRRLGAQLIVIEPGSFGITSLVGLARAARRVTSQQSNREGSRHANR
jgi:hypothetical protein